MILWSRGPDEVLNYEAENARPDTAATVSYLASLAGGGDVLEFGPGLGRITWPLAAACRSVTGVELSPSMVERFTSSGLPSNAQLHQGDMRTWRSDRRFDLVIAIYNLLLEIPAQEGQLRAVVNAADHVKPGGYLVLENAYPPVSDLERGSRVVPVKLRSYDSVLVTQIYDWRTLTAEQTIVYVADGKTATRTLALRLLFPSEQDLMARMGGLTPTGRFVNWQGRRWTSGSEAPGLSNVISVYRKPEEAEMPEPADPR